MKKKIMKIVWWVLGIILGLALVAFIAFQVSPKPSAMLIARAFNGEVKISDQKVFDSAAKNVTVSVDETYQSKFKDNTYDVYYPKASKGSVPVLLWVHGGGYVGGDKEGAKEFATRIASDAQVAVVSMNYQVAPSSQYPNQVVQVEELISALKKQQDKRLDLSNLFLGGDSAGGQIALQFAATQTNPSYAKQVGISQVLDAKTIKGAISYCGPVDIKQMADQALDGKAMKFFIKTVAWSLIGTKNWQKNPKLFEASVVDHVTTAFPPTYITDGNAYSFQDQGLALVSKLTSLNLPVTGLFYKDQKKQMAHEYQFNYATDESKACYEQTLQFVKQYK
ncbi:MULTISPECIES: alpha/beta hydrolase [Pseudolactococcus]|uniref:Putative lipase n=1 Tax=Pseudolactococcus piscium MKFS47 TaxID=297352 RepID=A0A0D6DW85_9LACT|nr:MULTISPECIES: alpha/beta hydrolase [Lactococcus]MCJ1971857.1 alpha/beta hydrolase [Lactococcus carnosus]CEN27745.1 Putative lipase [Lactococcus piscium MKFS47]